MEVAAGERAAAEQAKRERREAEQTVRDTEAALSISEALSQSRFSVSCSERRARHRV